MDAVRWEMSSLSGSQQLWSEDHLEALSRRQPLGLYAEGGVAGLVSLSHSFVLNQSGTRSPLTLNSGKRKHSNLMLLFAEAKCSKFELLGLWVIRKPYVSLLLFALFTGKGRMQ